MTTDDRVRTAIRRAREEQRQSSPTARVYTADLVDQVCRTDAVGRVSTSDVAAVEAVMAELVRRGARRIYGGIDIPHTLPQ